MNSQDGLPAYSDTDGFTLIEVVVALAVTMIMIGSVFGLMASGQTTFRRETQVADMQMSTRSGLELLSRDLAMAGFRTPPAAAIIWADSGGTQPDEVTIVYADPDVPLSNPLQCGGAGGPCGTIGQSSTLLLDPEAEDLVDELEEIVAQDLGCRGEAYGALGADIENLAGHTQGLRSLSGKDDRHTKVLFRGRRIGRGKSGHVIAYLASQDVQTGPLRDGRPTRPKRLAL